MLDYSRKTISGLTRLGMRKAFGKIICGLACEHENMIVLAADTAGSANLNEFAEKFPDRFYNAGIAEQNMAGIASGMAKEGANVFIVSFAPFVSMRAYEAIRTLIGYMHLNVKIVGLSSGFSLGQQGNTHYCFEDAAIMKSIPGMLILSPADCAEEMKCLEFLSGYAGPAYLRLTGIDGTPGIYKEDYLFNVDEIAEIKAGDDAAIIASGSIVNECVRASRALKAEHISAGVYNAHTLKPFDSGSIEAIARKYKLMVSVEEHNTIGGLGSSIADVLSGMDMHPVLVKLGIEDEFVTAGDYSYLLEKTGLSASKLKEKIMQQYERMDAEIFRDKRRSENEQSGTI